MWLFRVGTCLLFCLCVGCQFQPLYEGTSIVKELSQIRINVIQDRTGQMMRNQLEHSLTPDGVPVHPLYILSVTLNFSKEDYGYLNDATATRSRVVLTTQYTLRNQKEGKIETKSAVTTSADFNLLTGADYATIVVDENAYKRAILLAAEQIKLQLARHFINKKNAEEASHESAPESSQ